MAPGEGREASRAEVTAGALAAPVRTLALLLGKDTRETWKSFEQGDKAQFTRG